MRYAIFKEWGDYGRWLALPMILIRMFRMEVQTKREHTKRTCRTEPCRRLAAAGIR